MSFSKVGGWWERDRKFVIHVKGNLVAKRKSTGHKYFMSHCRNVAEYLFLIRHRQVCRRLTKIKGRDGGEMVGRWGTATKWPQQGEQPSRERVRGDPQLEEPPIALPT